LLTCIVLEVMRLWGDGAFWRSIVNEMDDCVSQSCSVNGTYLPKVYTAL